MLNSRVLITGVIAGVFMLVIQSCGKMPVACFTTTPSADSIHVNMPVIFDGRCSISGGSYNWQFYDNPDSIAFTPTVTKIFKDTGTVEVYLLVLEGNNDAGTIQDITVQP